MLEKWFRKKGEFFKNEGILTFSLGYERPMFRRLKHNNFGIGGVIIVGDQWEISLRLGFYTVSIEKDTIPF